MTDTLPDHPPDPASDRRTRSLSGVDALVQLLLLRHQLDRRDGLTTATMVSGYPGSPLGTLDLALDRAGRDLESHRVVHCPGLNEELAAATVWGSQMGAVVPYAEVDGVAGAWYGKAPGVDRAGDALKHANAMGAGPNGGAVLFCGDDPSAKSSTLTCDSQHALEDACIPVLFPADQQDVIDLGVHAFRLSRFAGPWVGLKVVTSVADGIGTVDLDPDRHPPPAGPDLVGGQPWHHEPLTTIGPHAVPDQEALVIEHRLAAAQAYVRHHGLDRFVGPDRAALGIVCAGTGYPAVVQALADLGVGFDELAAAGVRILKLAMTFPLVPDTVRDLAASVDTIVVVEEKRPFVERQLRSVLHEAGSPVRVAGKRDLDGEPLVASVGELTPAAVADALVRVRPSLGERRTAVPVDRPRIPVVQVPGRPPGFCSGCPHNRSTLVPAGALAGGGVGCHGIMYFEARQAETRRLPPTPMGAEGVPWIGLAPFVDEPHLIQNIGDGTLSHSGTLAIRASVAAGVDVTFKVLYNAAVAMTGGQEVTGLMDVPALTRALEAEGVRKVVVCAEDPTHYGRRARWAPGVDVVSRDRLPEVQEALREVSGVTVVVYDQQCAAEASRLRKAGLQDEPPRRVVINEAVCEGCGDCSTKSNCLSVLPVQTEMGEKRQIHDPSCNRDYTCLEGDCPSFVTLEPSGRAGRDRRSVRARRTPTSRVALPPGSLPEVAPANVDGTFGVYFTGIGGTGVVTANRVLAAAAEHAGFAIGGLDQTGLSQKAGSVVSHLHLAVDRTLLAAAAVGPGGADLYLSGDLLQAAVPMHLERVRPGTTLAVVDTDVTPSAPMLQAGLEAPDLAVLEGAVAQVVGAERCAFVDAKHIAEAVFGDHRLANIVLLGAGYQRGALPVALADLEAAFERQGRAAAANRDAFTWGRWAVHDEEAVAAALAGVERNPLAAAFEPSVGATSAAAGLVARLALPEAVLPLVIRRTAQVVDYQSTRLAERYLGLVEQVSAADDAEHGWTLTEAVAQAWHHLLTYKDEYEVARLHLAVDYERVAADLGIEGRPKVTYQLHPPVLRRLGRDRKLPMGRPYELGFRVLRRMRWLRGTPFDAFGWDRDRRLERSLIREYEQLLGENLADDRAGYDDLVALARSPLAIKGYAGIKEAAAARWREEVGASRSRS